MDYARNILHKYGWKEGQGLGKDEKGISKPLKCGLKFDKAGIGYHDKVSKEENNPWWIHAFNQAAANICTSQESNRDEGHEKKSNAGRGEDLVGKNIILTDEELFRACGGRTAHKGARHGLRQNGKLKRIHEQEKIIQVLDASNKLVECPPKKKSKLASAEGRDVSNEIVECSRKKKSKLASAEDIIENGSGEKQVSRRMKKKKSRNRERDAVTSVPDCSASIGAEEGCDNTTYLDEDTSKCVIDEKSLSNEKSVNSRVPDTCPVLTDSIISVETEQVSDHPRPRKRHRKSISETEDETKYIRTTSKNDATSRKSRRKKR